MKAFLIDVENVEAKEIELEPDLDTLYKLVNCSTIDIVTRKVGDVLFDVVCDDEGLLKAPYRVSAIDSVGRPMLVGNLLFCHHDNEGNLTGLSENDIKTLALNVYHIKRTNMIMVYGLEYDI